VVIIHEIPGITAEVVRFADEVVAAGFTVVMPHLFGTPGAGLNPLTVGPALRQVCVSSEFTKLATGVTAPVATWLRSLARELGDRFVRLGLEGRGHATLTGQRHQVAGDRVLAFFGERLKPTA
jgi:dienelactone hydrolase